MKKLIPFNVFVGFSFLISFSALSATKAMVVSTQGTVSILTNQKTDVATQAIFEGQKYFTSKAKIGQKIHPTDVVMCGNDGKAKIIYENGDVVIVSSSSSLVIPDEQKTAKLVYGKTRMIIDKEGPLSGVKVRTPSAVAGVRGTDLFVEFNSAENNTEVKVMRGEVQVQAQTEAAVEKTITVKAGEVGEISVPQNQATEVSSEAKTESVSATPAEEVKTEVKKMTTEEIKDVRDSSTVKADPTTASKEVQVQVAEVEKKAVENIIRDVQRYDPNSQIKLDEKNYTNIEEINTVVLKMEGAPSRKKYEWTHFHINYLNIGQESGGKFNTLQFGYSPTWNLNDQFTLRLRTEMAPMKDRSDFFPTIGIQPELQYQYKKLILSAGVGMQVWLSQGVKDNSSMMESMDFAYQTHFDSKFLSKIDRVFIGGSYFEYPKNDKTYYVRVGAGFLL
jgi:hypothetical protein